jgi:hypothetical protein
VTVDGETVDVEFSESEFAKLQCAVRAARRKRSRDLDRQVARLRELHPDWTKDQMADHVPRRRTDVLSAFDRVGDNQSGVEGLASGETRVPEPGNAQSEAALS